LPEVGRLTARLSLAGGRGRHTSADQLRAEAGACKEQAADGSALSKDGAPERWAAWLREEARWANSRARAVDAGGPATPAAPRAPGTRPGGGARRGGRPKAGTSVPEAGGASAPKPEKKKRARAAAPPDSPKRVTRGSGATLDGAAGPWRAVKPRPASAR